MRHTWRDFWDWYNENYRLNVTVAAVLFGLQIVHLIWLFGEVVWVKLTDSPLFSIGGPFEAALILVDYTEIPALITVSLVYVNDIREANHRRRAVVFLILLNSQWLHLFWITDEFVVQRFAGVSGLAMPAWLAWVAILIDFLEVPVIVDTIGKMFTATRQGRLGDFARTDLRER